MNSHVLPPTWVPSTHVGRRPQYSATSIGASSPRPEEANPSTSSLERPASAMARLAAWKWSSYGDRVSTRPQSESAAPTTATRADDGVSGPSRAAGAGRRAFRRSAEPPLDPLPGFEELLSFGDRLLVGAETHEGVPKRDRLAVRKLACGPEGPDRPLHRELGLRGDGVGGPRRGVVQLGRRDDLGHEPDLVGPPSRQPLIVPEEGQPHDLSERHAVVHVDRLERRGHPVGDVRVEERGVVGGDDELDFTEHVERAAAGHAVDRGNDRLPEVRALRPDVVAGIVEVERRAAAGADDAGVGGLVGVATHLFHPVDASTERLLAGAGEDDAAHRFAPAQRPPALVELTLHERVEGVVAVGSVQRDPGHAVTLFVLERLELWERAHGSAATSGAARRCRRWWFGRRTGSRCGRPGRDPTGWGCRPCRSRRTPRPFATARRRTASCRPSGAPGR